MIKEVIVVEGRHDESRIKSFIDCDIIITNGSEISLETLSVLKNINEERGIIILTDPDSPGERIRSIITNHIPSAKHAFIEKKYCIGKRNVGIEYASKEAILSALESVYEISPNLSTISWDEYVDSGIMFHQEPKRLREFISNELNIGKVNNKQLFKRLNMFGIEKDIFYDLIQKFNKNN